MKVTTLPSAKTLAPASASPKDPKRNTDLFQQQLRAATRRLSPSPSQPSFQEQAADPLTPLEGTARMALPAPGHRDAVAPGLERVEAALDLLDAYQRRLADSRVTLKEMMPLVQALEQHVRNLSASTLEGELADLASEVAITAQVEISRFHRGDYL